MLQLLVESIINRLKLSVSKTNQEDIAFITLIPLYLVVNHRTSAVIAEKNALNGFKKI